MRREASGCFDFGCLFANISTEGAVGLDQSWGYDVPIVSVFHLGHKAGLPLEAGPQSVGSKRDSID
jgi:hypothetical protein